MSHYPTHLEACISRLMQSAGASEETIEADAAPSPREGIQLVAAFRKVRSRAVRADLIACVEALRSPVSDQDNDDEEADYDDYQPPRVLS